MADIPGEDGASQTAGKAQNGLTKKVGPLPVWAYAVLGGGLFFLYLRMRKGSAATSTIPMTQAPAGFSLSADPSGGLGNGAGSNAPSLPVLPVPIGPAIAPIPPAFSGQQPSGGGSTTIPYGNAATGQTGSMTFSTYDTPSGGAPTPSNPGRGMIGWTQQQWQDYNNSIAREWGIAPDKTGILNDLNSLAPAGFRTNGGA